jgi:hypothetical protein
MRDLVVEQVVMQLQLQATGQTHSIRVCMVVVEEEEDPIKIIQEIRVRMVAL